MKYSIHTWGCKVNTYDSGLIEERMQRAGFEASKSEPKVHLLNTCAVTQEATKEAVRFARRLKAKDPFCTVVVTGCGAQVDTDHFSKLPGVDLVVANSHKGLLEEILRKHFSGHLSERVFKSNIFRKEDLESGGGLESGHTRSFLKIQDGCNSFCTYCVIPFARGKSRSIPIVEIMRRTNDLYKHGIREVVLTGVHIGDYEDGSKRLEDLIQALLQNTDMPRFRLGSLEPVEVTPRLLELFEDARLCPHFHMSIQSANTKVLREMKRQYTAEDVERSLTEISERLPQAYVGMDVIVGFAGETDAEFSETVTRLRTLPWTRIHVFPYSVREGTKAATRTDLVDGATIKHRAKVLSALSDDRETEAMMRQMGLVKKVLPLRNPKAFETLSRDYWPVFTDQKLEDGKEHDVRITRLSDGKLFGEPVWC